MKLSQIENWVRHNRELLFDLIRIYLGLGLFIKGIFFLAYPEQMRIPPESGFLVSLASAVPIIHLVGGLFLALGVFTRLAALSQIPILFAAVFFVNAETLDSFRGREGLEFSALVLFLLVLILIKGAGPLRLMRVWGREEAVVADRSWQRWLNAHPDLFLDLVRIYLGAGLIVKGFYIMGEGDSFLGLTDSSTNFSLLMAAAAHYVIPAHLMGGFLLIIGFATRAAAIAQLPLLAGAVFYLYLPRFSSLELRQNLEFTALVLFLLALISVAGAGRYSLDHLVEKHALGELQPRGAH